jgi:hypothetical protein
MLGLKAGQRAFIFLLLPKAFYLQEVIVIESKDNDRYIVKPIKRAISSGGGEYSLNNIRNMREAEVLTHDGVWNILKKLNKQIIINIFISRSD